MDDRKIQLQHPQNKKAVKMDIKKYELLKNAIIRSLKKYNRLTHRQLNTEVLRYFEQNNVKFPGSVSWHLEWVKLDLESKGAIERTATNKNKQRYSLGGIIVSKTICSFLVLWKISFRIDILIH